MGRAGIGDYLGGFGEGVSHGQVIDIFYSSSASTRHWSVMRFFLCLCHLLLGPVALLRIVVIELDSLCFCSFIFL